MRLCAAVLASAIAMLALGARDAAAQRRDPATPSTLVAFASDAEFTTYLRAAIRERMMWRDTANRSWRRSTSGSVACGTVVSSRYTGHAGAEAVIGARIRTTTTEPVAQAVLRIDSVNVTGIIGMADSAGWVKLRIPARAVDTSRTFALTLRGIGLESRRFQLTVSPGDSIAVDVTLCRSAVHLGSVVATSMALSVTNVQHEGVDEGGIVKLAGDYLVVLRRGRLHTIRVRESGTPRPVHTIPAYGPDVDPSYAWYDELLVVNDRVVVIGYSYERGGTEIGLFRLGRGGRLSYEATYQLRANDYYSSRNYASRLVGTRLLFYSPLYLPDDTVAVDSVLPALRRWRGRETGAGDDGFRPIVTARNAYRPARPLRPDQPMALHTVTSCDLAARALRCDARVVVGPPGHEFYMSPTAVYVWTTGYDGVGVAAAVHRMPFDGAAATALRVAGSPVDQFSFLESDDRHLNVVVHGAPDGGWMWSSERRKDSLALLRVPLSSFRAGGDSAPASAYRPIAPGMPGATQNRFVGEYVILAGGSGWGGQAAHGLSDVYVASWRDGTVHRFATAHDVERIEAMNGDAVLVGADTADLHFTTLALDGRPRIDARFSVAGAAQGETRSHGFFYKTIDWGTGVLGLPIREAGTPGYAHLFENSAAVVFLRRTPEGFRQFGRLSASTGGVADDRCVASCVDWYGNARPLFIGKRVFALLGGELVEGWESRGALEARRRVAFAGR